MKQNKKKYGYQYHFLQIRLTGIALLLLLAGNILRAQYDVQLLNDIAANYEKVYVKLDRDVYISGGTIRYRAFLVDAGLVRENVRSKILYFELSGPQQAESIHWRVNLSNGNATGAYEIPAALPSGMYTLKAYTNWLRNGDPDYIYSTDILLFNISDETSTAIAVHDETPTDGSLISFYPEGGTVIEDVPCKIGYLMNGGKEGLIPQLLTIKENDSTEVLQVVPDSSGFGSFIFVPETGKNYFAELSFGEGQVVRTEIPYIEPYGYSLHAEEAREGLNVTVHARISDSNQRTSLHLMAECRGNILLDTVFVMTGDSRQIHIPASRLDAGILYLTLYDSRRFSLSQRLFFIDRDAQFPDLRIRGMKDRYARNETIQLELSLEGIKEGDSASFAVLVSEQHPFQNLVRQPGILEYYLLFSEIKDLPVPIQDLQDLSTNRIQDLLLLVHDNDYAWNYSNKTIPADCRYDKEENGFILKGNLTNRTTREPLANVSIMISVTDSIAPRLLYARTDENGEFYTLLNTFFDNKELIIQVADDVNPSDLVWNIEPKTLPAAPVLQRIPHMLTETENHYAEQSRNIQLIGKVFGTVSPVIGTNETDIPEIIFLQPDRVVYPSDFTELVNFKEIADNILPTVRFISRNRRYSTEVFNSNTELWLTSNQVLLNGILYKDLDYIATLGSNDILKIEIYNTNVLFGNMTLPGLIAIYTYDGTVPDQYVKNNTYIFHNEVTMNNNPMADQSGTEGLEDDHALPDFKQILYWSPDLRMSGSEPVILEFNASQLQGRYILDIQGVSERGIPLGSRLSFTVE